MAWRACHLMFSFHFFLVLIFKVSAGNASYCAHRYSAWACSSPNRCPASAKFSIWSAVRRFRWWPSVCSISICAVYHLLYHYHFILKRCMFLLLLFGIFSFTPDFLHEIMRYERTYLGENVIFSHLLSNDCETERRMNRRIWFDLFSFFFSDY